MAGPSQIQVQVYLKPEVMARMDNGSRVNPRKRVIYARGD